MMDMIRGRWPTPPVPLPNRPFWVARVEELTRQRLDDLPGIAELWRGLADRQGRTGMTYLRARDEHEITLIAYRKMTVRLAGAVAARLAYGESQADIARRTRISTATVSKLARANEIFQRCLSDSIPGLDACVELLGQRNVFIELYGKKNGMQKWEERVRACARSDESAAECRARLEDDVRRREVFRELRNSGKIRADPKTDPEYERERREEQDWVTGMDPILVDLYPDGRVVCPSCSAVLKIRTAKPGKQGNVNQVNVAHSDLSASDHDRAVRGAMVLLACGKREAERAVREAAKPGLSVEQVLTAVSQLIAIAPHPHLPPPIAADGKPRTRPSARVPKVAGEGRVWPV